ncbi:hypothetical protein [Flexithrix dorotheae]|uniref:hypothetical protein n=1 Tax=Flexithrix dorotheae TaxID=70993 RepID=UPI0003A261F8|nr:hypothetical protein [Flexithrix dorotheae]
MLLSPILDTGISFIFFYFTLSTLASTLNEWWLQYRQTRGKLLRWSIEEIMNDHLNKNFADILYNHPLVDLLKKKQTSYPPYIPNEVFTKVLIDIIGDEYEKNEGKFEQKGNGDIVYEKGELLEDKLLRFKAGLETLQYSDFKKWLETFCKDARTQEELEENISTWFSYYMEQVRGWFKIRIQKGLFLLGLIISIFLNVNSIHIAKSFWQNHQLRGEVTSIATNWYEENKISSMPEESDMQTVYQDLKSLQELPIGWKLNELFNNKNELEKSPKPIKQNLFIQGLISIIGWLMSALFISFGAPLWFEILGKVMSVKSSAQKDK